MKQAAILLAVIVAMGCGRVCLDAEAEERICADCSVAVAYSALERETSLAATLLELPDDGRTWHTVYVFDDNRYTDPVQRKISAWCAADSRLRALNAQTVTHVYTPASDKYADYKSRGPTPQIWVIREDAAVAYFSSGTQVPSTADELVNAIAKGVAEVKPPDAKRNEQQSAPAAPSSPAAASETPVETSRPPQATGMQRPTVSRLQSTG